MNAVNERAQGGRPGRSPFIRMRTGAIIAVAVAVAIVVWLVLRDDGDDTPTAAAGPVSASESDLRAVPDSVGYPVFWSGSRSGYTYELTKTTRGVYVRYLPPGVPLGENKPKYLTIASYPFKNAYAATKRAGRKKGAITRSLPGGGIAIANDSEPKSAYVSFRGTDVQVEVFDPSSARARRVAFSGRVVPVR